MTRRTVTTLTCDADCFVQAAEGDGVRTYQLTLNGVSWEKDLCDAHAAEVRAGLLPFAERARTGAVPGRRHAPRNRTPEDRDRSAQIRMWARAQPQRYGRVPGKGRIPDRIVRDWENEAKGRTAR